MDVALWTGDGVNGRAITGLNFSPDFVWIKNRTNSSENSLFDTVRGAAKTLYSNQAAAELASSAYGQVNSFDAAGFTLTNGSDPTYPNLATNFNGSGIVGWAWDAGTSTVSNTQGSITSQVRANATAGFSVVTYTGTLSGSPGTAPTVGHGLGVAPRLIISKSRTVTGDENGNWYVNHAYDYTKYLRLNGTGAELGITANGGGTTADPTSSVFSTYYIVGSNTSGNNYIAYCFAPVVGYSNFGSYVGNGSSTDGPFVYTGFRPRWVMIKSTSIAGDWPIWDAVRSPENTADEILYADLSNAEQGNQTALQVDINANGFKIRGSNNQNNGSGATYIYAAFAEMPFNYSRAR
jgi:hypothetical protein